jgi:hypothetical protein
MHEMAKSKIIIIIIIIIILSQNESCQDNSIVETKVVMVVENRRDQYTFEKL